MRSRCLAIAVAMGCAASLSRVALAEPERPATEPATRPAEGDQVPVKEVVLFSSGVGYFEHFGTVKDNGSTELHFKTEQINDVLKSLLLQDLDNGHVGTVSYPSQAPIGRTLKSFQIDITANPTMGELLAQLRGAKVSLSYLGNHMEGTIVGVENKRVTIGKNGEVTDSQILNLKSGSKFHSVPLDDVTDLALDDEKLQRELDNALEALAESRDQDKKPVSIEFRGKGERRLRIGYVVETPIWKTSYRLVLDPKPVDAALKPPATAPASRPTTQPMAEAKLQGWAIVENQTDNDWRDVQLSLVSGRPISYIEDLYHSIYLPRPIVHPDLSASLRPQTYENGISKEDMQKITEARNQAQEEAASSMNTNNGRRSQSGGGGNGLFGNTRAANNGNNGDAQGPQEPIDPTATVIAAASAGRVGELFQYTVGNVTIPRQRSAMIPIVTDNIEVEKVSVFNEGVLPNHPLSGVRIKNSTHKFLLQGPITVIDGNSYAGDARIEDLPPGQERLISYGIDLRVLVDPTDVKQKATMTAVRITKGVMQLTQKEVNEQNYLIDNKGDKDKLVVIEHPRDESFKLTAPEAADETTASLYRFRRLAPAHRVVRLHVAMERVDISSVELTAPTTDVAAFASTQDMPANVKAALAKAIEMKQAIVDTDAQVKADKQRLSEVSTEQVRIRENMKTVAQSTDYYTRLIKKLDEQETAIESTQKVIKQAEEKLEAQKADLSKYLSGLSVG